MSYVIAIVILVVIFLLLGKKVPVVSKFIYSAKAHNEKLKQYRKDVDKLADDCAAARKRVRDRVRKNKSKVC